MELWWELIRTKQAPPLNHQKANLAQILAYSDISTGVYTLFGMLTNSIMSTDICMVL